MATYANMCEVRVGDVVQCFKPDDCVGLVANQNYTVSGVVTHSTSQFVQLREKCSSLEYPAKWFQLISRAPSPAKAEPLVKDDKQSKETHSAIDALPTLLAAGWRIQFSQELVGECWVYVGRARYLIPVFDKTIEGKGHSLDQCIFDLERNIQRARSI